MGWVVALVAAVVLVFGRAFGAATQCSNAFSCTELSCPESCERIGRFAWVRHLPAEQGFPAPRLVLRPDRF